MYPQRSSGGSGFNGASAPVMNTSDGAAGGQQQQLQQQPQYTGLVGRHQLSFSQQQALAGPYASAPTATSAVGIAATTSPAVRGHQGQPPQNGTSYLGQMYHHLPAGYHPRQQPVMSTHVQQGQNAQRASASHGQEQSAQPQRGQPLLSHQQYQLQQQQQQQQQPQQRLHQAPQLAQSTLYGSAGLAPPQHGSSVFMNGFGVPGVSAITNPMMLPAQGMIPQGFAFDQRKSFGESLGLGPNVPLMPPNTGMPFAASGLQYGNGGIFMGPGARTALFEMPHRSRAALRLSIEFQVQGGVSVAEKCIQGGRQPDMALTIKVCWQVPRLSCKLITYRPHSFLTLMIVVLAVQLRMARRSVTPRGV